VSLRPHRRRGAQSAGLIADPAMRVVDAALSFAAQPTYLSPSDAVQLLESVHDELGDTPAAAMVTSLADQARRNLRCREASTRREVIDVLLDIRLALSRPGTVFPADPGESNRERGLHDTRNV
jgi:hypothetical protein